MANILSLFDGMACGHIAMEQADIPIDSYIAYEIDKYAIQTATHNFPDIVEKGDVFDADFTEYKGQVDYLIGGSPCTYWSIAQKNNRETEASGLGWELFSQYVRALKEAELKYFLYENNKSMSKAIRESITETFGFEPICINSALVSAQNRQRLYWVGKREADGTYSKVHIEQPEDRGILLKDIEQKNHEDIDRFAVNNTRSRRKMWFGDENGKFKCKNLSMAEKSDCVTTKIDRYPNAGLWEYKDFCRYPSVRECARLQQIPEWIEFPCSDSQSYKQIGNGWSICVIEHLLRATKE